MGKKKKKHAKHSDSVSNDLFDATALSIKKYRKVTNEIAKLSPTQKLVGGLALLAAGYLYVRHLQDDDWRRSPIAGLLPTPVRVPQAPEVEEAAEGGKPAPHKRSKAARHGKHAGSFGKKPATGPTDV